MSSVNPSVNESGVGSRSYIQLVLAIGGLERGDLKKALGLGLAYGAVLASLYVLKPARNALFLSRVGPSALPAAMCVVAVVGGLTALALSATAGSFRVERLIRWLLPLLSCSLLGWWYGLSGDTPSFWVIASFYVWVNLYGQLTTALLWLLAGAAVDARQSRRVFAFMGALGIAGAVAGGVLTRQVAPRLGTVNLLPLCALILLIATFAIANTTSMEVVPARRPLVRQDRLNDVRDSRLLRVLLFMTLLGAIATSVIDFQFNAVVSATLPNEDAKAAFFGSFFAYLNAGAFVFQLLFTSRVMNRFGLGSSLLVLPTALGLGGVFGVVVPGLTGATLLKASDASLRHSLYRSAVELLFVPLPGRVKRWFRVFLDATVDNVGTGLGALAVLALTAAFGLNHRLLAMLSVSVVALWAVATLRARSAHVEAFRDALESRQIQPDELVLDTADGSVVQTLLRALDTRSERQLIYVLGLVSTVPGAALSARLIALASHQNPEVRARALAALAHRSRLNAQFDARPWLSDTDGVVRREAATLLARTSKDAAAALAPLVEHVDPRIRVAGLGAAIDSGLAQLVDIEDIRALLSDHEPDAVWTRRELARALGSLPRSPEQHELLVSLAGDPSADVARQAMRSAGQLRDPVLADFLIEKLADRTLRPQAIEALALYGAAIVPRLDLRLLTDRPMVVQVSVTRVLARIDHPDAVRALLVAFEGSSGVLRHSLLKSLNKQKERSLRLSFDVPVIATELAREMSHTQLLLRALAVHSDTRSPAGRLLLRAIEEKRKQSLEDIFRLLALRYIPKDLEVGFIAITSNHPRARAQALEFLDNYLDAEDRRRLLPLLEARIAEPHPNASPEARARSLRELFDCNDGWLRACAIFYARGRSEHTAALRAALDDPAPLVREAAELALSGASPSPEKTSGEVAC